MTGAEWSLFWPGSGIAFASSARVKLELERPVGALALGAVVGAEKTILAGGTMTKGAVG